MRTGGMLGQHKAATPINRLKGSSMTTKFFPLALAFVIALASVAASAMGFDIQSVLANHGDTLAGLSMLGAGSLDLLSKSLDKIDDNLGAIKTRQSEFEDRLLTLEQRRDGGDLTGEHSGLVKTLGSQFLESFEKNRELFEKTRSVRLELKAAGDAITTTSGRTIVSGGVGAPSGSAVIGFQYALPTAPAPGTSAVEYSRFTGTQGSATVQAGEGAAKSAVRPDHTLVTQTALTVAGYAKMSRQALNDSNELKKAVDITLARAVGTALDVALVSGGTGFSGGYAGLATAHNSAMYTLLVDAISEAVAAMQTAGLNPNIVVMTPASWLQAITARGTSNDHYFSGDYMGQMPTEMRGLRVVLSPTVTAGKALLIDSAHSELKIVDGFSIELAYSGDDFTSNLVTCLGEMRAIPVFRTTGSMRLVSTL
jgi:hypothetical protein